MTDIQLNGFTISIAFKISKIRGHNCDINLRSCLPIVSALKIAYPIRGAKI